MITIKGGLAAPQLYTTGSGENRYFTLTKNDTLTFFKALSLVKPNIAANDLGVYTLISTNRHGEASLATFKRNGHFLQPFKYGCQWTPQGGFQHGITNIDLYRVSLQMEICHDVALKDCLESIYGVGNEIRDLLATPEGQQLLNTLLELIFEGIGNDVYDLLTFGQHPLITKSYNEGWFRNSGEYTEEQYETYRTQQGAAKGHLTIIDAFKAEGLTNYNVAIPSSDYNGALFTGDVGGDLFPRLTKANSKEIRRLAKRNKGTASAGIILVQSSIWDKYRDELITLGGNIVEGYALYVDGDDGRPKPAQMPDAYFWNGIPVICADEWDDFDHVLGITSHRAVYLAPGSLAVAFDVRELEQFNGLGLQLVQRLAPPYNGKIYLHSDIRLGAAIVDRRHISNASVHFQTV